MAIEILYRNDDIHHMCIQLQGELLIGIDFEFIRKNTYWPRPSLLQIASKDDIFIVDLIHIEPESILLLKSILFSKHNIKILHSARQDLEIIYMFFGEIPSPIFDTQIAAELCGLGVSIGYSSLIHTFFKKTLDKSQQQTDWGKRPLTNRQISYAHEDVKHLLEIYNILNKKLRELGRLGWLEEEITRIYKKENFLTNPKEKWKQYLPLIHDEHSFKILKKLCYWREAKAQKANCPKSYILKNKAFSEIIRKCPKSKEQLEKIIEKKHGEKDLGKQVNEIFLLIERANNASSLSPQDKYYLSYLNKKDIFAKSYHPEFSALQIIRYYQSKLKKIPENLIAQNELLFVFYFLTKNPEFKDCQHLFFLEGWRYEVFGKSAEDYCNGLLKISIIDKKFILTKPEQT